MLNCVLLISTYDLVLPKVFFNPIFFFSPLIFFPISRPFDFPSPPPGGGNSIIYRPGNYHPTSLKTIFKTLKPSNQKRIGMTVTELIVLKHRFNAGLGLLFNASHRFISVDSNKIVQAIVLKSVFNSGDFQLRTLETSVVKP